MLSGNWTGLSFLKMCYLSKGFFRSNWVVRCPGSIQTRDPPSPPCSMTSSVWLQVLQGTCTQMLTVTLWCLKGEEENYITSSIYPRVNRKQTLHQVYLRSLSHSSVTAAVASHRETSKNCGLCVTAAHAEDVNYSRLNDSERLFTTCPAPST